MRTALDSAIPLFVPLTRTRSWPPIGLPKRFTIGHAVITRVSYSRLLSLDKLGASQRHEISRGCMLSLQRGRVRDWMLIRGLESFSENVTELGSTCNGNATINVHSNTWRLVRSRALAAEHLCLRSPHRWHKAVHSKGPIWRPGYIWYSANCWSLRKWTFRLVYRM